MWPMAWPISEVAEITVYMDSSRLEIPVRTPTNKEKDSTQLELAEAADAPPHIILRDPSGSRIITSDIKTGYI